MQSRETTPYLFAGGNDEQHVFQSIEIARNEGTAIAQLNSQGIFPRRGRKWRGHI